MQKHIKKLSTRELSLMGKAIILNTLTLAKTAHLSNVFPIPREIFTQIQYINKYFTTFDQKTKRL